MVRLVATFLAVWFAFAAVVLLLEYLVLGPIPNSVVSVVGLAVAAIAAYSVYRRRP